MTLDEIEPELIEPQRLAECVIDALKVEHRRPVHLQQGRRGITARDALRALHFEAFLVCIAAANLANGIELSEEDRQRLMQAFGRIDQIVEESDR